MDGIIKKISKIKGIKYIVIALAAAVILLCLPSSDNGSELPDEENADHNDAEAYITALEKKTEALICEISGIKNCKVMISAECGYSYSYAADQSTDQTYGENGSVLSDSADKKYVTVNFNGSVTLVKTKTFMPKVSGIAVICPGAAESAKLAVMNTVKALFDINSNRISIQS